MLDVSLLKNPVFIIICISNMFGMAGLYIPFVYLVDAAKQGVSRSNFIQTVCFSVFLLLSFHNRYTISFGSVGFSFIQGIPDQSASLILSIIGITNTFGRVMCGYVADFPSVDSLLLNNVCLIVATIAVAVTPICVAFWHYVVMSVFFGLSIGTLHLALQIIEKKFYANQFWFSAGYISLTSIILVDLLGLDKLTNAFGLLILFRGAAAIVGPPLAGIIYDATKTYDMPFFTAAAFFAISTVLSFAAPFFKRYIKHTCIFLYFSVLKIWVSILAICSCMKPSEIPVHMEQLTPIDEDDEIEDDANDEDQPITMIPKIMHTAPSPTTDFPPTSNVTSTTTVNHEQQHQHQQQQSTPKHNDSSAKLAESTIEPTKIPEITIENENDKQSPQTEANAAAAATTKGKDSDVSQIESVL